ncbi:hypothetical protein ACQPWY_31180 [Pseudonocardia xinjiangensis]|uniref:hypothetical protein n=1 Tax=Pseudonocardia xinjiangensis TaxID=75289 RepID=UPI003D8D98FF
MSHELWRDQRSEPSFPRSVLLEVRQPPAVAVQCAAPVAVAASLVFVVVFAAAGSTTAAAAVPPVGVPRVVPELVVSQVPLPVRQSALASRALATVLIAHSRSHVPLAVDVSPSCEAVPGVELVLDDRHPFAPSQADAARVLPVVLELLQPSGPVAHEAVADLFPVVALVSQPCFAPDIVHVPEALFSPEPAETLQPDDRPARPMHRSPRCSSEPRSPAAALHSKNTPLESQAAFAPREPAACTSEPSWPVAARSSSVAS